MSATDVTKRAPVGANFNLKKQNAAMNNIVERGGYDLAQIPSQNPDVAWSILSKCTVVREVPVPSTDKPRPPDTVRLVCISDTHGLDNIDIPPGDILIHAGDFTNTGQPVEVERFNAWLGRLPHKHKIVIAGNHDLTFDQHMYPMIWERFHKRCFDYRKAKASLTNCVYLEDNGITLCGYNFWGSPWQPEFCKWAFNLKRGRSLKEKWDMIPDSTDIVISHGPPIGYRDLAYTGTRAGCVDLLRAVQRVKPLYNIFGHIHEGYGMATDGTTIFVNASTCSMHHGPTNPPIIIDLPARQ